MDWPDSGINNIYEVSIEVVIWSEQPTVKTAWGDNLGHLRKEINVTGRGEAVQNSSGVVMRL